MTKGESHKHYSAEDIQRYHEGKMSGAEMHALEKAALEDPFLSDALEGFAHASTPSTDLKEIQQRIATRTGKKRKAGVVRLPVYMRIAALVLLLAGAGWILFQVQRNDTDNLALESDKTERSEPEVEVSVPSGTSLEDTFRNEGALPRNRNVAVSKRQTTSPPQEVAAAKMESLPNTEADQMSLSSSAITDSLPRDAAAQKEVAGVARTMQEQAVAPASQATPNNVFRGQVVDANNRPIPHVNIITTNREQTTADNNGYFSLVTPDSVVNATVSAIGYGTNRTYFNTLVPERKIVLQESPESLSEVVVTGSSTKKRSALPGRVEIIDSLIPEPGWIHFNQYIHQQLNKNKEAANSPDGEVELSFNINNIGRPVNIRVEKSLCPSCDAEAVRLLKAGPRWKGNTRKKGRVKIGFGKS